MRCMSNESCCCSSNRIPGTWRAENIRSLLSGPLLPHWRIPAITVWVPLTEEVTNRVLESLAEVAANSSIPTPKPQPRSLLEICCPRYLILRYSLVLTQPVKSNHVQLTTACSQCKVPAWQDVVLAQVECCLGLGSVHLVSWGIPAGLCRRGLQYSVSCKQC